MRAVALCLFLLSFAAPLAAADHETGHVQGRVDVGPLVEHCEWDSDRRTLSPRPGQEGSALYCRPQA